MQVSLNISLHINIDEESNRSKSCAFLVFKTLTLCYISPVNNKDKVWTLAFQKTGNKNLT